jgi:tight adherence protein B
LAVSAPRFVVSGPIVLGAVAALAVVLIIGLALAFGVFRSPEETSLERRLAGYGRRDPAKLAPLSAQVNVKDSALALAQKALGGGFDVKLAKKLDAAGISLRPAEWLLAHAGCAVGAALLGLLLGSGSPVFALLMLAAGVVAPWLYLGFKQARRIKAFNAQLAETLQLMAGGLSAGLSFAQSVDTIVREGTEPVCGEFRRALIEARLGVDIEDALDGVAARMGSADFEWVVMAVRIQREVGGNLAELLVTVSSTLREREHLRRQVQTLSAEGRLSAWILCGLPPIFLIYLALTRADYIAPMFHTPLGWVMLGFSATLMTVGSVWMSKVVKVEV